MYHAAYNILSVREDQISNSLYHHGILGQKWGVKNGPPYPLKGEQYSSLEEQGFKKNHKGLFEKKEMYDKRHKDKVITTKDTLSTLSYDADRTKKGGMFYAAYKPLDKHQYNVLFNKKADINGVQRMKYRIDNKVKDNMKVASEDSAAKTFMKLYENDRDFCNFVKDENRMQKYFDNTRYRFKGYVEARKTLEKMREEGHELTDKDLKTIYRMFNYVIPYDGKGTDERGRKDVENNRNKLFNSLKKEGYGAILDTNDSIYGAFKAKAPVIVFDMDQLIPDKIKQTDVLDQSISRLAFLGSKVIGI